MIAKIILDPDNEGNIELQKHISEIVRSSYDYQKDNMFYESVIDENREIYKFTFYLEDCDQPQRTLETLDKIKDLLMHYI